MGMDIHIGEMLARNARMYPNETALVERNPEENKRTEITWKQFDEAANRFANVLIKKGIKKGDKVIHLMMNSIDWLIVYFGIVRTGAWVVPLNFRFTGDDIKYCVEVAEPRAMIFGEEFTDRIDAIKDAMPTIEHYVFVGKDVPSYSEPLEKVLKASSSNPPGVELTYADPCGLYFTSGTTGKPKPILLNHKNMFCACLTENYNHKLMKQDTFILIPPLYHTGAKMHWFGSFVVGGRGVILKGATPEYILDAVSEEKATVVFLLVPWAQDILLKFDSGELKPKSYNLSQWRLMHIGAQPVPPSLIKHWKEYFPNMDYDTNYGLSESTGPGCVHLGMGNEHKIGAIGIPSYNWETQIIDPDGNPVPQGGVGELTVRGDGVMIEYYKNPEATANTLVNGWLRTGDMARMDDDGFIFLVDRKKDIIICGGENVFPVEIEDFLHTNKKIKDVAAIGYPDERLGELVTVVIEVVPGQTMTEEEVLKFCEGLPRYKRPRKVIFGDVPRNPTGKIEKPKLRKQYIGIEGAFKA